MSASEILQSLRQISALVAEYSATGATGDHVAEVAEPPTFSRREDGDGPDADSERCWKEDTRYFLPQTLDSDRTFLRRGSVRGVKDGVKSAIEQLLLQTRWEKNYEELDRGKVVVYMTSLGVVRRTWENCRRAVAILENHRCYYERRDLNLCQKFIDELRNRSGQRHGTPVVDLPKIYVDGLLFGSVDKLEQWSEVGELKNILEPYKRLGGKSLCSSCYGFRFAPCSSCRGGKKSAVVVAAVDVRLRCARCDSCGLVECTLCADGFIDQSG